jgi:hypothetical protein
MHTIVNVRTHREDNRGRKKEEGSKEESRRKERTTEE